MKSPAMMLTTQLSTRAIANQASSSTKPENGPISVKTAKAIANPKIAGTTKTMARTMKAALCWLPSTFLILSSGVDSTTVPVS